MRQQLPILGCSSSVRSMTVLMGTSGKAHTRCEHPSFRNHPQNTLKILEGLKALQQQCTVESLDRFGLLALAFLHISLCHSIKPAVYVCQQNELKPLWAVQDGWWFCSYQLWKGSLFWKIVHKSIFTWTWKGTCPPKMLSASFRKCTFVLETSTWLFPKRTLPNNGQKEKTKMLVLSTIVLSLNFFFFTGKC